MKKRKWWRWRGGSDEENANAATKIATAGDRMNPSVFPSIE